MLCATRIQRINDCYRMNRVFKKRLSCPFTTSFRISLVATTRRLLNERSALYTGSVPSAESLRPVKGNVSGPRWH